MEWKLSIGLVDNLDLDPKWIRVYIRDTIGWILSGEILFREMNPCPDPSLGSGILTTYQSWYEYGSGYSLESGSGSRILSGKILFREMNPHPDPSLSLWHSNHISVMIRIQIRMYTLGLKVDPDPEYCLERYSLGKWTHIRTHLCLSCILTTYSSWYGYGSGCTL